MKKYKLLMTVFFLIYLIVAVFTWLLFNHMTIAHSSYYRVEFNRVLKEVLSHPSDLDSPNDSFQTGDMKYVKHVSYLPVTETSLQTVSAFYEATNGFQTEIVPVVKDGKLYGYLRADYVSDLDMGMYLAAAETAEAILFVFAFAILWYTYSRIMLPFNRLSSMPYELSKGNLTGIVEENKNRYFGKFVWGLGMLKDSLETHKRHELKLVKEKKMMILSISHDIKTPLNAISLYARAIEKGLYERDEEICEAACAIVKKTEEIDVFVNQIVKSSTEDVVSVHIREGDFYLKELMDKIDTDYREKCRLRRLDFQIASYQNVMLYGDLDKIYEAAGNLLENAIKYGDGRKIGIDFKEEEGYIQIMFCNSGEPVKESELPHLFDSFYRGSNSGTKAGNGLGLYICREIMKQCKGDIYVKREMHGMQFVLVCRQSR